MTKFPLPISAGRGRSRSSRIHRARRALSPPAVFLICSLALLALSIAWGEGTRAHGPGPAAPPGIACTAPSAAACR